MYLNFMFFFSRQFKASSVASLSFNRLVSDLHMHLHRLRRVSPPPRAAEILLCCVLFDPAWTDLGGGRSCRSFSLLFARRGCAFRRFALLSDATARTCSGAAGSRGFCTTWLSRKDAKRREGTRHHRPRRYYVPSRARDCCGVRGCCAAFVHSEPGVSGEPRRTRYLHGRA